MTLRFVGRTIPCTSLRKLTIHLMTHSDSAFQQSSPSQFDVNKCARARIVFGNYLEQNGSTPRTRFRQEVSSEIERYKIS
jgi:hypothetical protein